MPLVYNFINNKNGVGKFSIYRNLNKILSRNLNNLIADKTASNTTLKLFSTEQPNGICCQGDNSTDPVNPVYIRNTSCWAKDIDTSPISIWNNGGGYPEPEHAGGGGGTGLLVTKRHLIFANHFHVKAGKKLIFVDMNNNAYVRTLTNIQLAYKNDMSETDILVGVLDSDLPDSITPLKILHPNKAQEFYQTLTTTRLPVFLMDVERKVYTGELLVAQNTYNVGSGTVIAGDFMISENPTNPSKVREFYPYHPDTFGYGLSFGDSANICAFVYKNKLVYIFHIYESFGGENAMICPFKYIDQINQAINNLGNPNGYQLQFETLN